MLNWGTLWGFTNWLDQCCLWFETSVTPTYYSECKTDLKLFYDAFIEEYKIFHIINTEWKFMTFQFVWACGPPMEWIITIFAVDIHIMSVSDIREYSKTSQRTISIWEIIVALLQQHKLIHTTFQLTFIHIPGKPLQDSAWRCDIKERNRTAHNFAKHGVMEARWTCKEI